MDKQTATTLFESLSSGVRLDVFRLLVKHAPTGLVAGDIAGELALPATNLSFHLKAMTHAGLVSVTQEGPLSTLPRQSRHYAGFGGLSDSRMLQGTS